MAKINFKKIQERAMSVAGLVAGSVAANYAANALETMAGKKADGTNKITPMISSGILVAASAALPSLIGTGKAKGFIEDFANGMMAQAGFKLAVELKVPGVHGVDLDGPISDYVTTNSLGASDTQKVISGSND